MQKENESIIGSTDAYTSSSNFFVDAVFITPTSSVLTLGYKLTTEFISNNTSEHLNDSEYAELSKLKSDTYLMANLNETIETTVSEMTWPIVSSTEAVEVTTSVLFSDPVWTKQFVKHVCNVTVILCGDYEKFTNQDAARATMITGNFLSNIMGMQNGLIKNLKLSNGSIVITFEFYTSEDPEASIRAFLNLKEMQFVTDAKGNQYPVEQVIFSDQMFLNTTATESTITAPITTSSVSVTTTTLYNLSSTPTAMPITTDSSLNFTEVIKLDFMIEDDFNNVREWGLDDYSNNVFDQIQAIINLPHACFEHFMLTGDHFINATFELKALPQQNITRAHVQRAAEKFVKLLLDEKLIIKDRNGKELKILPASASIATAEETEDYNEAHHQSGKNATSYDVVTIIIICMGAGSVLLVGIILVNVVMKVYFNKKFKKQIFPHNGRASTYFQIIRLQSLLIFLIIN